MKSFYWNLQGLRSMAKKALVEIFPTDQIDANRCRSLFKGIEQPEKTIFGLKLINFEVVFSVRMVPIIAVFLRKKLWTKIFRDPVDAWKSTGSAQSIAAVRSPLKQKTLIEKNLAILKRMHPTSAWKCFGSPIFSFRFYRCCDRYRSASNLSDLSFLCSRYNLRFVRAFLVAARNSSQQWMVVCQMNCAFYRFQSVLLLEILSFVRICAPQTFTSRCCEAMIKNFYFLQF